MTEDEMRALLIEEGAIMLAAHMEKRAATERWETSARKLAAVEQYMPDVEVQVECFEESCTLAGLDPDDPRLAAYHEQYTHMARMANAELN